MDHTGSDFGSGHLKDVYKARKVSFSKSFDFSLYISSKVVAVSTGCAVLVSILRGSLALAKSDRPDNLATCDTMHTTHPNQDITVTLLSRIQSADICKTR